MRTRLLFLAIALLPAIARGQDPIDAKNRDVCAIAKHWSIGSVSLQDSRASVLRKLGKPISIRSDKSEDDGGVYKLAIYTFKSVEVVLGRRGIEYIGTTSKNASLAQGLRIGMREAQVGEVLGFTWQLEYGKYEIRLPHCHQPSLDEMILYFEPAGQSGAETSRLAKVAITRYGP